MRRLRPSFLLIIAILAWVQSFLWTSPGLAAVPIKSSAAATSVTLTERESLRIRGSDLLELYESRLKFLTENLKNISPLLTERIKENFFGLNWYLVDLKPNVPTEFGEVWIYRTYFSTLNEKEQTRYLLREILDFEFLRTHDSLRASDHARIEAVIAALEDPRISIDSLAKFVDQADLIQPNQSVWTSQIFLTDPAKQVGIMGEGILFSYKDMRFFIRHCDEAALFDLYQRIEESSRSYKFAGLQTILERISRSGKCTSVDQKLYTIPLRTYQKASEQMRVDLQKKRGLPSIFWNSFAWIGTIEVFVNTHLIRIIRQPVLRRLLLDIVIGGAVSLLVTMSYKFHENKKNPSPNPSVAAQIRLLSDLQHNLKESPINFYQMGPNAFLKQTQEGLKELQAAGYLETIVVGQVPK